MGMRLGMCTCQLRLRAAKDAVIWCDKAHTGDGDDLTTLYLLVDAKALNGEEHAGLQLLKTAQRRFPRDRMLHDKIQALEQRIKRQGNGLFKTSPKHAAVMMTESVVTAQDKFRDCGKYLGALYSGSETTGKDFDAGLSNESSTSDDDRYSY